MPDKKTRLRDTLTVLVILTNFEARIIPCFELSSWEFLSCALPKKATAAPAGQCDAGGLSRAEPEAPPRNDKRIAVRKSPVADLLHSVGNIYCCKICATIKDQIPDFGHAVRDMDFFKIYTIGKYLPAALRRTVRCIHFHKACTAIEKQNLPFESHCRECLLPLRCPS